jgi:hypothetical protein
VISVQLRPDLSLLRRTGCLFESRPGVYQLREPLITPNENEREATPPMLFIPGSLLHARCIIVPYGISDGATTFARLQSMKS